MKFANDQSVIAIVKNPLAKDTIEKGRKYESRLRLFTEPKFAIDIKTETAWNEFLGVFAKTLTGEQRERIKDYIQFPLSSIPITEAILSDLYKVFSAGNSFFNVSTVKENGGEYFNKLLTQLNIQKWIEEVGKKVLKNKPNTIIVIDKTEKGDPYLLEVSNNRLLDVSINPDGCSIDYLSFIHSIRVDDNNEKEVRTAVYDSEKYYVVLSKGEQYSIESAIPHGLNYCPARMFINKPLNNSDEFSRVSPLAPVLSKLQEWQQFDIFKYYTDHYAPFPVTEMVREECVNQACENGWIRSDIDYFDSKGEPQTKEVFNECPQCKDNNKVGVGGLILLDAPEEGKADSAGLFRMISNETNNLTYLQDKLNTIEDYIAVKVVGVDKTISKEAVNEKQVKGSFESKSNVLLEIKTNLDDVYKWIVLTLAGMKLKDKPINVSVSFGTEWYLVSEEELQSKFDTAKKSGIPREEIDMIYNQLIETKYKGNPEKIDRLKMINDLNPAPYSLLNDKSIMFEKGMLTFQELIISERILTFVRRIEIDNGDINDFGTELTYQQRINKLSELLKSYTNEYKEKKPSIEQIESGKGAIKKSN